MEKISGHCLEILFLDCHSLVVCLLFLLLSVFISGFYFSGILIFGLQFGFADKGNSFLRNLEFVYLFELMGGSSSKEGSLRQNSSYHSSSSSRDAPRHGYPPFSYGQESPSYAPQHSYASPQYYPPSEQEPQYHPPSQGRDGDKRRLDRKYSRIADNYSSLDQVITYIASFY